MSNKRTGNYDEYVRLLNKYKTRHPLEKWSKESYKKEKEEERLREYLFISNDIMDKMKLTGTQRRDLKWLIRHVPLRSLHTRMQIESIIVCLCIYIRKSYGEPNFKWREYKIVQENDIDCNALLVVVTNLCIWFSRRGKLPLTPNVDKNGTLLIGKEI